MKRLFEILNPGVVGPKQKVVVVDVLLGNRCATNERICSVPEGTFRRGR